MKRKALLVEAGQAKNQKALSGPAQDVRRLRTWLRHNNGGAWEDAEIETLSNPTLAQVTAAVSRMSGADYALVTFSGHGWIEQDARTLKQTQKVIIGSGESIDLGLLRPKVSKCTIVADACREVEQVHIFNAREGTIVKASRAKEPHPRAEYRKRYDSAITAAGDGAFFLYGCSPSEYCYDDPLNGGYFTGALLDDAVAWVDRAKASGCLTIGTALTLASYTVRQMTSQFTPQQNPMGGPENRSKGNDFPFAVEIV